MVVNNPREARMNEELRKNDIFKSPSPENKTTERKQVLYRIQVYIMRCEYLFKIIISQKR